MAERDKGAIPDSIHIPLDELRGRVSELPTDQELILSSQSGLRSYIACRTLNQKGYRTRNLSGAYLAYSLIGKRQ
jgi:rhodanese-related sulfurtransferase